MPDAAILVAAAVLPLCAAALATPVAIRVAGRLDFYDRPTGWKAHASPTPYLGGAAVLIGFLVGSTVFGSALGTYAPIVGWTLGFWAVGTLDDRVGLPASVRVGFELLAGATLWGVGLGWELFGSDTANLVLSALWITAVVNALNLLDLMDGVASSVAAVAAAGAGALAAAHGDLGLAAIAVSLAGACLGFLPYNLARPPRIFLGDGGSMPIGFVVAATLMAVPAESGQTLAALLAAALLCGIPLVDMSVRILSRRRRGTPLLAGGPDSLANHLLPRLHSPRVVAAALAAAQAALALTAVGAFHAGALGVAIVWTAWFGLGTVSVALIDARAWTAPAAASAARAESPQRRLALRKDQPILPLEACLLLFIVAAAGLSPFFFGFYSLAIWGPITAVLLAAFLGLTLARPAPLRREAVLALGAVTAIWTLSLLSSGWAESADQARIEAGRWLLAASLLGVLVLLLRNDKLSTLLVGGIGTAVATFALYICVLLVAGEAGGLFLEGRLNEPLGYVNGQAGYLLLGIWPCLSAAEVARSRLLAGLGMGGAVLIANIVVLAQTRSMVPALAVTAVALLVFVPGRARRFWALAVAVAGVGAGLGWTLDLYEAAREGAGPTGDIQRAAGLAVVAIALLCGGLWISAHAAVERWGRREHRWMPSRRTRTIGAMAATVVALSVLAGALGGQLADKVDREYRAFVTLDRSPGVSTRFTSGQGNRYDYWRVAWLEFREKPLLGYGAGNYDRRYFTERRTGENIRQPHSLPLQLLAELGIVGVAGLVLLVLAAIAGFRRRLRSARTSRASRYLAVAAGGAALTWLVHTSVDWLHLIPGVTAFAVCALAVLVSPWLSAERRRMRRATRFAAVAAVVAIAVVGAMTSGALTLGDHYQREGRSVLPQEPTRAATLANRALNLNPDSLPTLYLRAAAEARTGAYKQSRATLLEASALEPHDFVPQALLGDLAFRRAEYRVAERHYLNARSLNPRDPALAQLIQAARDRRAGGS